MARRNILPSQLYLQECFSYDPKTGVLTWRSRPRHHYSTDHGWACVNSRQAGKTAGTPHYSRRYDRTVIEVQIAGETYAVSRVIVKMVYDLAPEDVDHRDTDGTNNRLDNLRPCDHSDNVKNKGIYRNNKSGFKGVHFCATRNGYVAQIQSDRKGTIIGPFPTAEEAPAKYRELSADLRGEFGRT